MKADLTRDTFDPLKRFTRVVMQQGRVQLDADWNEQAAILLRYVQVLAADLIGPHGGPADGFEIVKPNLASPNPAFTNDLVIQSGRYYVEGVLCELDATVLAASVGSPSTTLQVSSMLVDGAELAKGQYVDVFTTMPGPAVPALARIAAVEPGQGELTLDRTVPFSGQVFIRRVTTYLTQPDFPSPPAVEAGKDYVIYLDVWERHVAPAEDDSIREVALAGRDTATRARTVWQVKALPVAGSVTADEAAAALLTLQPEHRGRLRAMAKATSAASACITPPESEYRGPENQLYRVEIHTGGQAWDGKTPLGGPGMQPATFKWSRENGSVIFPIVGGGGATVRLDTLGRDDRFGLVEHDWVEVQDDDSVLKGRPGTLLQVQTLGRNAGTVTLSAPVAVGDLTKHPLLRRWDLRASKLQPGADGAAVVVESDDDQWLVLEDGVQIQFAPATEAPPHQYRTGDYWLIPARTATGDVEWPTQQGKDGSGNAVTVHVALAPAGVQHHYAPLAVVSFDGSGGLATNTSCRHTIKPPVAP